MTSINHIRADYDTKLKKWSICIIINIDIERYNTVRAIYIKIWDKVGV